MTRTIQTIWTLASAVLLAAVLAPPLAAGGVPAGKPEEAGMSSERLQRIHQAMERHIEAGDISGAVTLVTLTMSTYFSPACNAGSNLTREYLSVAPGTGSIFTGIASFTRTASAAGLSSRFVTSYNFPSPSIPCIPLSQVSQAEEGETTFRFDFSHTFTGAPQQVAARNRDKDSR